MASKIYHWRILQLVSLLCIIAIIIGAVGCGNQATQTPTSATSSPTSPVVTTGPVTNTPTGNPTTTTTPTATPINPAVKAVVVAALNTTAAQKKGAKFVCDGKNDEVEIQNAINSLPAQGDRAVQLLGDFIKGSSNPITVPSDTQIIIDGSIKLADGLNVDAAVFANSDPVGGNSGINIVGGHLVGNEKNNTAGEQYGIHFVNVSDSSVDSWIEDFRTSDELMTDSFVQYNNRNFDDKYTPKILSISDCDYMTGFITDGNGIVTVNSEDKLQGEASMDLIVRGSQSQSVRAKAKLDLRSYPLVVFNYKNLEGLFAQDNSYLLLYIYNSRLNSFTHVPLGALCDLSNNGWGLIYYDLSQVDFGSLTPSDVLRDCQLFFKINPSASTGADEKREVLIDNIYAIRGLPQSIVTLQFDDGNKTDLTEATYMSKYGWKGVSSVVATFMEARNSRMLDPEQGAELYKMGWDIVNHSYSHKDGPLTVGEQWTQDAAGRGYLELQGFTRSAKYRAYNGSQGQLSYANSIKINAARRYFNSTRLTNLPYGITQQYLSANDYKSNTTNVKSMITKAKKFHTWVISFCHVISDAPGETPVPVYRDLVDWLHAEGMQVLTFSEVYAQFPLETEPSLDFTLKKYSDTYEMKPTSVDTIVSKQDLSLETPVLFNLAGQPDAPRSLKWTFNTHTNITNYTLVISGIDVKGVTQEVTLTTANGWSGETNIAFASITSIKLTNRVGTGIGDTLSIGVGSKIGIRKTYSAAEITSVLKDGKTLNPEGYIYNGVYDTIDLPIGSVNGALIQINYQSNLNIPNP